VSRRYDDAENNFLDGVERKTVTVTDGKDLRGCIAALRYKIKITATVERIYAEGRACLAKRTDESAFVGKRSTPVQKAPSVVTHYPFCSRKTERRALTRTPYHSTHKAGSWP